MDDEIINRVAKSSIETIDLKTFKGSREKILFDLKENLSHGYVLKEKEFRGFIKKMNWESYSNRSVALTCSVDAIIPSWAYMLVISKLEGHAEKVVIGNLEDLEKSIYMEKINSFDFSVYKDKKVVIKGCSDLTFVNSIYVEITKKLLPFADSIMYGEPCSTVPIYKKKKNR